MITLASEIKPRPVRWLWPTGYLLAPSPSSRTRGHRQEPRRRPPRRRAHPRHTPRQPPRASPCRVMFAPVEDAWEFTMVPRLLAAGADLDMHRPRPGRRRRHRHRADHPVDVPALARLHRSPTTSPCSCSTRSHRDGRANRRTPRPRSPQGTRAARPARRGHRRAVVGNVHLGKGIGTDPVNLILGSRAFSAVARVALVAARDPTTKRATCCRWRNPTSAGSTSRASPTESTGWRSPPTKARPAPGLLVWNGETDRRVRDIMADADDERSDRDEAAEWLSQHSSVTVKADDVYAAADAAGLSEGPSEEGEEENQRLRLARLSMDGPWY